MFATEKDYVDAAEKVLKGDKRAALRSMVSVTTSTLTGHPIFGPLAAFGAERVLRPFLDTATERFVECGKQLDSEEAKRDALARELDCALAPLNDAVSELSERTQEQFLQLVRCIDRLTSNEDGRHLFDKEVDAALNRLRNLPIRRDVTWLTPHNAMLAEANQWRDAAKRTVHSDPCLVRVVEALFHAGVLVRTTRVLDNRFRWIVEEMYYLRKDPDDAELRSLLFNAILNIAHSETLLSCLESSLGALKGASAGLCGIEETPLVALIRFGETVVKKLGDTGVTPFAVKQDFEGILNGLERAEDLEAIGWMIDATERTFGAIDRAILRQSERSMTEEATKIALEYGLSPPEWCTKRYE
jgi:hypothetical protein